MAGAELLVSALVTPYVTVMARAGLLLLGWRGLNFYKSSFCVKLTTKKTAYWCTVSIAADQVK